MAGLGHHRHETGLATILPRHHTHLRSIRTTWHIYKLKQHTWTAKSQRSLVNTELPQIQQCSIRPTHPLNRPTSTDQDKPDPPRETQLAKGPNGAFMPSRMVWKEMTSTHLGIKPTHTVGILPLNISS